MINTNDRTMTASTELDPFNAQPHHHFKPLRKAHRNFRLLRLTSLPGDLDISVTLCERYLGHYLETQSSGFLALSYEWGDAEGRQTIQVDDQPYLVRRNLYDYLCAARDCGWLQGKLIYIDSICIDQNNLDERNAQVGCMHQIFPLADLVCAWLGPADEDLEKLFGAFHRLHTTPHRNFDGIIQALSGYYGTQEGLIEFLHAAKTLVRRTYWHRAWIVPELLLAHNVMIFCGCSSVSANTSFAMIESHIEDIEKYLLQTRSTPRHPGPQMLLEPIYRNRAGRIPAEDFARMLQLHAWRLCKDPRDTVYSLMSMMDRPDWPSCRRDGEGLIVDYHKSTLWLFLRVVAVLPSDQILRIGARLRAALRLTDSICCKPIAPELLDDGGMSVQELQLPSFRMFLWPPKLLRAAPLTVASYSELIHWSTRVSTSDAPPFKESGVVLFTTTSAQQADVYCSLGGCLGIGLIMEQVPVTTTYASYVLRGFGVVVPTRATYTVPQILVRMQALESLSLANYIGRELFRRRSTEDPEINISWLDILLLTTPIDARAAVEDMDEDCFWSPRGCVAGHWPLPDDSYSQKRLWLD